MRSPSMASESEYGFSAVANFLACVAVVALVAGALFFLIDLHVSLANGRSAVMPTTPVFFLIGVVAIQRLRARGEEIPYWPIYVIGLAGAVLYNLSQTTGGAPAQAKLVLYGGIALLWIVADRLTRVSTLDATDQDTSATGLMEEEAPEPGQRTRETNLSKHPGVLVMLFTGVTITVFLLGERFVTDGSLATTSKYLKLSVAGALALLAITAMFGHMRYLMKFEIPRSRAFIPVWFLSAGVLAGVALLAAELIPRTDAAIRNQALTLARRARSRFARAPVSGDPTAEESGSRAGHAPDSEDREESEARDATGRAGREGAAREGEGGESGRQETTSQSGSSRSVKRPSPGIFAVLRYLAWIALVVVVITCFLRFGRRLLRDAARLGGLRGAIAGAIEKVLARLLGIGEALRKLFSTRGGEVVEAAPVFRNPFLVREVLEDHPVDEAVRYAYEEMRKIADDLPPHARRDLTPYEFLGDLPSALSPFKKDVADLTELYCLAAYSSRPLAGDARSRLGPVWGRLVEFAENA